MNRNKENINIRKYLSNNVKATFLRVGISSIATLLIMPFIIKNIGIEKYSYISVTSFLVSFGSIFDLGFSRSLVCLVNEKGVNKDGRNQYISAIKIINIIIIAILIFFGSIAIVLKLNILGDTVPYSDPLYLPVSCSALLVLILSIYNMYQMALLEGFFLLDYVAYGVSVKIIVLNGCYLINLLTMNNMLFYILSPVVANLTTTLYYGYMSDKLITWNYIKPSCETIKIVTKMAISFTKIGILTSINSALPRLVIVYLTPNLSYVGILDVITKITFSIVNLFSSISRPFLALSKTSPEKIHRNFKKIIALYMFIGSLFWIGILFFSHGIIAFFFQNTDNKSYLTILLLIYSAASLFFLSGQPFSMYLQGIGKNETLAKIMFGNICLFFMSYCIMSILDFDILINLAISNILISIYYFITLLIIVNKTSN